MGGFFVREPYRPLGEVWIGGRAADHEPVAEPYGQRRACVAGFGTSVRFGAREAMPARPAGDMLQAGPLLLADGAVVFDPDSDHEGFSAGAGQFDSDITDGRHPRAALGVSADALIAVACDGRRSGVDAGLTMLELARVFVDLGADARDQPRRRRLDHAGAPRPSAQPALPVAEPARAGDAQRRHRAGLRAAASEQVEPELVRQERGRRAGP